MQCYECPVEGESVETYWSDAESFYTDLCPTCYHDAQRSGADLA